ncbi:hydrolase [Schizosaccharomyces japonicus yFS275]|uniref:Hydrolase n=1 Tax=Schizosaccharomyces japonicus (strain yFS275 / FY16936) TaxID=402676 RepID=B6JWF8_SCHJY|nr:hydrolase [Schizosaccharomyces japonicus yFS275]EEB05709.1 hydrolase [Schizosaccharomyces japonicus yFS275]
MSVTKIKPVKLAFEKFAAKAPSSKPPLVMLHGFMGSKQNWRAISKFFASHLKRDVFIVDQRCHGDSPHAVPLNYPAMAADMKAFLEEHNIEKAALLGHSMGAKTVMRTALLWPQKVSELIVADNSLRRIPTHPDFIKNLRWMMEIEKARLTKRGDADKMMTLSEKDPLIRGYLLSNLARHKANATLHFRVPLQVILDALPDIGASPLTPDCRPYTGPTCVIRSLQSGYVEPEDLEEMKRWFPNSTLVPLDCGHWVHYEKTDEFKAAICDLLDP